jgi:exodeoxyribonuclease V alpha subunit
MSAPTDARVSALLQTLDTWSAVPPGRGAAATPLRRLDRAFAAFLVGLCPETDATVVLAAALLAHVEGRGHACLPVDRLLGDRAGLLDWPAPALDALDVVMATLPASTGAWLEALRSSALVSDESTSVVSRSPSVVADEAGARPLVLFGNRLYLRRYRDWEQRIADALRTRCAAVLEVDAGRARTVLDALFAPAVAPRRALPGSAVDWQKVACAIALRGRFTIVTGGPGTGKTHTAARLLVALEALRDVAGDPNEAVARAGGAGHAGAATGDGLPGMHAWPARPLRIGLAAPTGKAAARLTQSIDAALAEIGEQLELGAVARALAARLAPARTLHGLLGARPETRRMRYDALRPLPLDVLVVDEASMIDLEVMDALLEALPVTARLVLLGDQDQLASVEAGAVLGDLCRGAGARPYAAETAVFVAAATGEPVQATADRVPTKDRSVGRASAGRASFPPATVLTDRTVVLRESRRFGGAIGVLAAAVNAGDVAKAEGVLRSGGDADVRWLTERDPAAVIAVALRGSGSSMHRGYGHFIAALRGAYEGDVARAAAVLRAFERFRVLCAVREGPWGATVLSAAIEDAVLAEVGIQRLGDWYDGQPLLVTRNDASVGVVNGDVGVVLVGWGDRLARVWFQQGDGLRSVAVGRLSRVETAYAMTVHKAQGSEFEQVALVLPTPAGRGTTRELVYTGVTRARLAFTLVCADPAGLAAALAHPTQRAGGLAERLAD